MTYDDTLYEACPICEGDDPNCVWCDGVGLVEHECAEPDPVD